MLAGTLASMGEGRYFARRVMPDVCRHRSDAYGDFLRHRAGARRLLPDVVKLFKQTWRWEPQMGGYAWARCTRQLIKLDTIIQTLDTQDRVIELISAVNTLVNFAHNTGRYLNKFLSGEDFAFAESGRLAPILSALMSDGLQAEPVKYAYPCGILPPKLNAGHGRIAQNRTVAYVSTRGRFGLGTDDGVVHFTVEVPQDCITELGTCDGDVSKMLAILKPTIDKWAYRWLRDFHINLGMYDFYGYTSKPWGVDL